MCQARHMYLCINEVSGRGPRSSLEGCKEHYIWSQESVSSDLGLVWVRDLGQFILHYETYSYCRFQSLLSRAFEGRDETWDVEALYK